MSKYSKDLLANVSRFVTLQSMEVFSGSWIESCQGTNQSIFVNNFGPGADVINKFSISLPM